jgi:DNA-binding transcriptional LysR family regulator
LVNIDLQLNDRKVNIVEEGFDVALRIGNLKDSSLVAKYIAPIRLILCASPAYLDKHGTPGKPADLKGQRYLHYSYTDMDNKQEIYQWIKSKSLASVGELHCNNGDVLTDAVIAGAGFALQPTFMVSEAFTAGRLSRVLSDYEPEPMGLYAVYAHRKLLPNKVRSFIEFIDGYYGAPPYWDEPFMVAR